ncbi:HupE/UreJ family protein [uncultured Thiohalocapsa sp.]|uniref:HupE/UreJ family protein n=1 Tax=uncultured Thiohalocapsa sp. TaxID=768990 RepID=UPI0025E1BC7E|nr:HupE/UreJ family protein [uncultured Thiohalocapsa sp.]
MTRPTDSAPANLLVTRTGTAAAGLLATMPALAHHPMGGMTPATMTQGLLSGLGHPVIGIDHFAFLVVAALLAFTVTGAARWLLPAAFIGGTVAGTLIHVQALDLPAAELLVAASVLAGGALVVSGRKLGAGALALLLAGAGVFHGYAYGESIVGADAPVLGSYLAGFALIQYAVIAGLLLGLSRLAARSEGTAGTLIRTGGIGALAVGGLFLVAGLV